MNETAFPESFKVSPRILYMDQVDFKLQHQTSYHSTNRSDLIYVIDGHLTVLLSDDMRYSAAPGEILIMPGHLAHRDIFQIAHGVKALIISYEWEGDSDFFHVVSNQIIRKFTPAALEDVCWILERMRNVKIHFEDHLLENSRLHTVLLLLYEAGINIGKSIRPQSYRSYELFDAAKGYIQRNYARNIDRTVVARALNISVPTLTRAFRKYSSYTFNKYLNSVRLEMAKRHLRNGHRIDEVALLCGFNDACYFAKVFRAAYGVSPGNFRS